MKAWVCLLYAMFEEKHNTYEGYLKTPEGTKKAMLKLLKEENCTLERACSYLPVMDVAKIQVKTLEELFELDVKGFNAKVIKGEAKQTKQMCLEEIIKFKPKLIK